MALMRDRDDVEDLVRETYLRAFRSWHTVRPGASVRRWLFAICYRRFLRMRERARVGHEPVLRDGIDRLLEPYRSALILVDIDQQSYEAASMILDIPIGMVRSRVFRARRLLRRFSIEILNAE